MISFFSYGILIYAATWPLLTSQAFEHSSSSEYESSLRYQRSPRNGGRINSNTNTGQGQNNQSLRNINRRENSKDLKRLIQELEESDYGNYGSWGNFRSRSNPLRASENILSQPQLSPLEVNTLDGCDDRNDRVDYDYYQIQEFDEVPYWENQNNRRFLAQQIVPIQPFLSPTEDKSLKDFDTNKLLRFSSVLKLMAVFTTFSMLSYLAVSPRNLSLAGYNQAYKENMLLVAASLIGPAMTISFFLRNSDVNINAVIHHFVASCTVGYSIIIGVELVLATILKLLVLRVMEPTAFKLTPTVPAIALPWVLKQHGHIIRQSTLFATTLILNCVMAPIVEEFFKLKILQRGLKSLKTISARKERQTNVTKCVDSRSSCGSTLKSFPPAPLPPGAFHASFSSRDTFISASGPATASTVGVSDRGSGSTSPISCIGGSFVPTVRTYVVLMMTVTLGIKVMDNVRRVLLYTRPGNHHKMLYAVLRGLMPVQELCGAMTALSLAKKELSSIPSQGTAMNQGLQIKSGTTEEMGNRRMASGVASTSASPLSVSSPQPSKSKHSIRNSSSTWSLISSSVCLHAFACYRGKKPLFVWASHRPWSELQVEAFHAHSEASGTELILSGGAKMCWFLFLVRVFVRLVKQFVFLSKEVSELQQQQQQQQYAGAAMTTGPSSSMSMSMFWPTSYPAFFNNYQGIYSPSQQHQQPQNYPRPPPPPPAAYHHYHADIGTDAVFDDPSHEDSYTFGSQQYRRSQGYNRYDYDYRNSNSNSNTSNRHSFTHHSTNGLASGATTSTSTSTASSFTSTNRPLTAPPPSHSMSNSRTISNPASSPSEMEIHNYAGDVVGGSCTMQSADQRDTEKKLSSIQQNNGLPSSNEKIGSKSWWTRWFGGVASDSKE